MRTKTRLIPVLLIVAQALVLVAAGSLPTPESVLGFRPGADNRLATYDQSIEYLKRLASASPALKLVEAGRTTSGRTMYFALVSDPKNLARIDRYREIAQRLAHPEGLTDADARALAREGRALVHLDGGCHASEVAGAQMMPQLAYDLLARADEVGVREILENDIVLLWPTMDPDGQQMVAEWLASNAGTPYENSALPRLYQEYVGHDNNRDAYMLNMVESRVMEHFWRQWEPNIIYVLHQSPPFPTRIWLPPFSEPVGLNAPPVIAREVNMIGMAIAQGLEERGQVGAVHMGTAFDAWYPGYVDYAPVFKNIPAFWTETAGNGAAPREYTLGDIPQGYRDFRPGSLYSSPWRGGWWRLADAVAYDETGALSTLEYAAKYRETLLYNRYQAGRDQIARGRTDAPFAYFVPQDQPDPVAPVEMLRRLAFGGVRVFQLTAGVTVDQAVYPAGTWVVPTDQEFGALVRELLDVQAYPDLRLYPGGPPQRPYDAAGWTLPLQMGVRVGVATQPLSGQVRAAMALLGPPPAFAVQPTSYVSTSEVDPAPYDSVPGIGFDASPSAAAIVPPPGRLSGRGPALAVSPAQNNAFRAVNRAWRQGATVALAASASGGTRYVIAGLSDAAQADLVKSLALVAERTAPGTVPVRKPRIGLFQPWTGSMDEGWTRWLLEQYGFQFVTLHPEDFRAPLRDRVDVVILADDARIPIEGGGARTDFEGRGGGAAQAPAGARGGRGAVRPEYAYALTQADLQAFDAFVHGGGTVVCLNGATRFAIQQFKLPVRNVAAGLKPEEFFLRGSLVEVRTDPAHPVMAGMPEKAAVFVDGSPVFETLEGFQGQVLARYPDSGSPLLSGYLIGEKYLEGRAAALDVQVDRGHVLLIGFRPQWRGQSFGAFRVLFNAALYNPL
jgi:hypothetical protein